MDKVLEIQKRARENALKFERYIVELQNWEAEMKRKEAALNDGLPKELPPVRSKGKKERPHLVKKKIQKKISSADFGAWDKFDIVKACEYVDMGEVGPVSLDGLNSQKGKHYTMTPQQHQNSRIRDEAQNEKLRGNAYVREKKWDEAISCYNRAIDLVQDDAIYYANRGLCYLMKDSLHQAESDCTEALKLDPTYVKALQRRASARERLGSLRAASHDLNEVLKLEPHNAVTKRQLDLIKARMGTKGNKSKSSPIAESKQFKDSFYSKLLLPDEPSTALELSALEKWKTGEGEGINVMRPVKKPPHLRSKRALKSIPIQEILLGKSSPDKPSTRLKIIEIEDNLAQGDSNNNDSNTINGKFKEEENDYVIEEGDSYDKFIGEGDSNCKPKGEDGTDEVIGEEVSKDNLKADDTDKVIGEGVSNDNLKEEDGTDKAIGDGDSNGKVKGEDDTDKVIGEGDSNGKLKGEDGTDKVIEKGDSNGKLKGEIGTDKVIGEVVSNDNLKGKDGTDKLIEEGDSNGKLKGKACTDKVNGEGDSNGTLKREIGTDKVIGDGVSNDNLKGEDSTDKVIGEEVSNDNLKGEDGTDKVIGEEVSNDNLKEDGTDKVIADGISNDNLKGEDGTDKVIGEGATKELNVESIKLITETAKTEKNIHGMVPPVNSVQFMAEWKYLKGQDGARSKYLSIIEPSKIPSIFDNALESDVLSEILQILCMDKEKFREKSILAYLKALCRVKRFSALAMFLSTSDKQLLKILLEHIKNVEKCSEEDVVLLKNKFEF